MTNLFLTKRFFCMVVHCWLITKKCMLGKFTRSNLFHEFYLTRVWFRFHSWCQFWPDEVADQARCSSFPPEIFGYRESQISISLVSTQNREKLVPYFCIFSYCSLLSDDMTINMKILYHQLFFLVKLTVVISIFYFTIMSGFWMFLSFCCTLVIGY